MSKIIEIYGRKTGKTTRTAYVPCLTRQENETLAIAMHYRNVKIYEPYNVIIKDKKGVK